MLALLSRLFGCSILELLFLAGAGREGREHEEWGGARISLESELHAATAYLSNVQEV